MHLSKDHFLLITRFKLQAKKLGIEVESSRMQFDRDYVLSCIEKAEESSDLEIFVTCQKIKDMFKPSLRKTQTLAPESEPDVHPMFRY